MRGVFIALALAAPICAQAPAFEVASVKPDKVGTNEGPGRGREISEVTPGGISMRNVRLSSCIQWAYNVKSYQVSGPAWITLDRYDIVAKAGGAVETEQLRLMLQSLLAERFGLALHREKKELPAYALLVGKNGPKLRESQSQGEPAIKPGSTRMSMSLEGMPLERAVDFLSTALQRPVVDMTGLTGRYDFTIDLSPYFAPDNEPGIKGVDRRVGVSEAENALLTAVQEQLGLRLEARKIAVELLVVDHAEKTPVEN
jgi:uncharacterized protein (TIGR03435 family)